MEQSYTTIQLEGYEFRARTKFTRQDKLELDCAPWSRLKGKKVVFDHGPYAEWCVRTFVTEWRSAREGSKWGAWQPFVYDDIAEEQHDGEFNLSELGLAVIKQVINIEVGRVNNLKKASPPGPREA
jgi:hypothetical protein